MYTNAVLKINKIKCYKYAFIHGSFALILGQMTRRLMLCTSKTQKKNTSTTTATTLAAQRKSKQKTKVCPQSIYLNANRLNAIRRIQYRIFTETTLKLECIEIKAILVELCICFHFNFAYISHNLYEVSISMYTHLLHWNSTLHFISSFFI